MAATAGYSGTPLIKKLGIKPGMKLLLLHAPDNYGHLLQEDISHQLCKGTQIPDLVHLFVTDRAMFEKQMLKVLSIAKKNTAVVVWVSWYKKSAGIKTDITEDTIRHFALANSLVDVKVCAVSDIWSGLKLVVPVALRRGEVGA
jgi:hypothetical protein